MGIINNNDEVGTTSAHRRQKARAAAALFFVLLLVLLTTASSGGGPGREDASSSTPVPPVIASVADPTRGELSLLEPPFPCPAGAKRLLLVLHSPTGTPPSIRTIENALRFVAVRRLCAFAVVIQTGRGPDCTARSYASNVDDAQQAADLGSMLHATRKDRKVQTVANENGVDATLHGDETAACGAVEMGSPTFPLRYFGWHVPRVCVTSEPYVALHASHLEEAMQLQGSVWADVSPAGFFVDGDDRSDVGAIAKGSPHHLQRMPCPAPQTLSGARVSKRRRHITALRQHIAERDPFGISEELRSRLTDTANDSTPSFLQSGKVSQPVSPDDTPPSCGAVRRRLVNAPRGQLSVALCVNGAVRTLAATIPTAQLALRDVGPVFWFASIAAKFPITKHDDIKGLRVLFRVTTLLGALILDRTQYPTNESVASDHAVERYATAQRDDVTSVPDALLQYLNVYLASLLRRMYEARCGVRFDVIVRMRTDTYYLIQLPMRLNHSALWVAKGSDFYGLNDQWWCGPAWLMNRMVDVYFQVNDLWAQRGLFHAETLVEHWATSLGYVHRPPVRHVELYRRFGDPIGMRHDEVHRNAEFCNVTHCTFPDP